MAQEIEMHHRMAAWRAFRGLTLQAVSDATGVLTNGKISRQQLSYVELGEQSISVAKLNQICKRAFRIDLGTFFGPLPKATS